MSLAMRAQREATDALLDMAIDPTLIASDEAVRQYYGSLVAYVLEHGPDSLRPSLIGDFETASELIENKE